MFIGWRGTVRALPTRRTSVSREASAAIHWTPLRRKAIGRFGLSTGICGKDFSPECSPVTSSLARTDRPLALPHVRFLTICFSMTSAETHFVPPLGVVAHRHGSVDQSWTHPRYGWDQVWLRKRSEYLPEPNDAATQRDW